MPSSLTSTSSVPFAWTMPIRTLDACACLIVFVTASAQ
jgi:hypothetical protein